MSNEKLDNPKPGDRIKVGPRTEYLITEPVTIEVDDKFMARLKKAKAKLARKAARKKAKG